MEEFDSKIQVSERFPFVASLPVLFSSSDLGFTKTFAIEIKTHAETAENLGWLGA